MLPCDSVDPAVARSALVGARSSPALLLAVASAADGFEALLPVATGAALDPELATVPVVALALAPEETEVETGLDDEPVESGVTG